MDQSLVHTFFWGNSYGPMVLKVRPKFPPTLVLVHGWLFPVILKRKDGKQETCKQKFQGIVLGLSWHFPKISWALVFNSCVIIIDFFKLSAYTLWINLSSDFEFI